MTTNSPTPTGQQFSESARTYAGNLRDDLDAMGCTLGIREVAAAYDAGAAAQSAMLAEAREVLAAALDDLNHLTNSDTLTMLRARGFLAKTDGAK